MTQRSASRITSTGARSQAMNRMPGVMKPSGVSGISSRTTRMRSHGILGVRAHGHRHVRAAREVDRAEADAVDHGRDLGDHRRRQRVGAPEALVAVADRRVDEPDHAGPDAEEHVAVLRRPSPFSRQTSATTPRAPATTALISFMTSRMQTCVCSSTALPTSTNGGSPGAGRAVERPDHRRRDVDEVRRRLGGPAGAVRWATGASPRRKRIVRRGRLELELVELRLVDEPQDLLHVLRRQIGRVAHSFGVDRAPVIVAVISAIAPPATACARGLLLHTVSGRLWRMKSSSSSRSIAHSTSCGRP